jgi:phosphoglycolate phosphatase-like HAD superfamily hydrolase
MSDLDQLGQTRVWLFDFDNTLAQLEREVDWAKSRRELEAFLRGAGVGDSIFREIPKGNLPLYEALRARLRDSNSAPSVGENGQHPASWGVKGERLLRDASSIIERYELGGVEHAEPAPGAIELLRELAARRNTSAIVTSNSSRTVSRWLTLHNSRSSINSIVGRDSLLALKPSPAMVLEALRRCDACSDDAVLIGDSSADLGAALASAVKFYGIATSAERHDHLMAAGASQIFESPKAFLEYLAAAL